jgi:predicted nucleic acid-binding protein
VAAIVYYELKRELLRAEKLLSINRLDAFVNANPGRYVPLSDPALRLAAELWAKSRQAGQPTAHSKALDIDVILAAQALSFGAPPAEVVIATTNPKHLAQFITAKNWFEILWNSQTPRRQDRKRPPRLRGCPRGAQLYRCCLTVDWRFSGY